MLRVEDINVSYGEARILRGVSFDVSPGEIVCLLGRNGAGKTTTMKSIMGMLPLGSGQISLDGTVISNLPPYEVPRQGIGYVPQGRRLFSELSVGQNLEIGMRTRQSTPDVLTGVLELFPRLGERINQRAETLSGGEQQMLATARALCLRPKVLLLDEPTEGLQPSMIALIRDVILKMRDEGIAVLLVEQRKDAILATADRVVFIENGENRDTMAIETLRKDQSPLHKYLGV